MPWKETCAMEQREWFIRCWLTGRYTKTELCQRFGISRPTGNKWLHRHAEYGMAGLRDRSRAAHRHPNAVDGAICERIVRAKLERPSWGPKKLLDMLRRSDPHQYWPADSTGEEILRRAGLVKERRRKKQVPPYNEPFAECTAPNELWCVDFKGDFPMLNGRHCYPLTVSDGHSRYLLGCQALGNTRARTAWPWFEQVFREYGLPWAIRSDNGAPFASTAAGGLTALSKWWIDLGIRPERIKPGNPQQNGRHERMHRSLKEWLGSQRAMNLEAQQPLLDRFREEFNLERSHESLQRQTPGSQYQRSHRVYPCRIAPPEYDQHLTIRSVRTTGEIKWRGLLIYLTSVLCGESVVLEPKADGLWDLYYRFHWLGQLDERRGKVMPAKGWHGK